MKCIARLSFFVIWKRFLCWIWWTLYWMSSKCCSLNWNDDHPVWIWQMTSRWSEHAMKVNNLSLQNLLLRLQLCRRWLAGTRWIDGLTNSLTASVHARVWYASSNPLWPDSFPQLWPKPHQCWQVSQEQINSAQYSSLFLKYIFLFLITRLTY